MYPYPSMQKCRAWESSGHSLEETPPTGLHNEAAGCGCRGVCSLDVGLHASLPPLPPQEEN